MVMAAYPEAIGKVDGTGRLPLHLAAAFNSPVDVVSSHPYIRSLYGVARRPSCACCLVVVWFACRCNGYWLRDLRPSASGMTTMTYPCSSHSKPTGKYASSHFLAGYIGIPDRLTWVLFALPTNWKNHNAEPKRSLPRSGSLGGQSTPHSISIRLCMYTHAAGALRKGWLSS